MVSFLIIYTIIHIKRNFWQNIWTFLYNDIEYTTGQSDYTCLNLMVNDYGQFSPIFIGGLLGETHSPVLQQTRSRGQVFLVVQSGAFVIPPVFEHVLSPPPPPGRGWHFPQTPTCTIFLPLDALASFPQKGLVVLRSNPLWQESLKHF